MKVNNMKVKEVITINLYFYELLSTIQFKEDVPVRQVQSSLAALIANGMTFSDSLKELHQKNTFKPYVFSMPYPREVDRVYHKGRMYCFNLRTLKLDFALAMKNYLPKAQGNARVVSVELRTYNQPHVSELISLTPIICTVDNRCWMPENGLALLANRLHSNAVKKCKAMNTDFTEPDEFFFELVNLLNQKPIGVSYKGTTLLGHKVQLKVKPHACAQQLAVTVLGQGLAEKNSIGFGYCIVGR